MPNNIISVAVHDLIKTEDGFNIVLGRDSLPVNKTTQRVVDDLHELYSRRSSKSHGRFSENDADYPTQGHLRAYVESDPPDFARLTSSLMTTLQIQARRRANAAGGHVFFAHFEREERQFLLVAIVNDKLGAALTRDLDVRDVQHLDMEGFRFAGRINMTGWAEGEQRYIGFLRGKGDVSDYFKEFLGCDTTIQDRQDTADLVITLKQFAECQGMDAPAKDDFLGRAKAICERSAKNRAELDFATLANELMPANPTLLLDVLTDPDRRLNDRFVPDRRALGSLVKFKAKTPLWSVEFEREALTGGNIVYDPNDNSLTICNLPAELAAQLRSESAVDGGR
jgi:nucleoid-associated protein